jgi:hypothetical protein
MEEEGCEWTRRIHVRLIWFVSLAIGAAWWRGQRGRWRTRWGWGRRLALRMREKGTWEASIFSCSCVRCHSPYYESVNRKWIKLMILAATLPDTQPWCTTAFAPTCQGVQDSTPLLSLMWDFSKVYAMSHPFLSAFFPAVRNSSWWEWIPPTWFTIMRRHDICELFCFRDVAV